ncbi:CocE/NonD family hydrolase [Ferruginivarius sediminum]|uniref:CocE/NonD family hydrolase n=1 Tax=Ferruginivarius sediminum TaxID=2661937 RepID=A0A369TER2_9PROT|nr:CocE/NonD family hydrolase [Ferruginivarius sediminum]RDD62865.1 CocE/NonD family hydrolase [Ferruginivarius sediminum]
MKIVSDFPRKVRVIENVWIPMSDGCRLAARIWLPSDADQRPVPAILEYMPYRKRDFTRLRDEPLHRYFAGHGYASIRLDLRGSGDSDGLLLDEYLQQELDDAVEAIEWIVQQPWSTGDVGMMGISWGGFNALQVAALRPPALKAIITMCSTDDRYGDDVHYQGGCLLNENLSWGSVFLSCATCPPDPDIVGRDWRAKWRHRIDNAVLYPLVWMRHPHRDDYWKHGSVGEDYESIACPVYAVGGWSDGYSNAIPRLMEGLKVPRKALIGPWSHAFPHAALPGPSIGFFQEALRWWDHWLMGQDTGIMDEPQLRVWMEEYVPPAPMYEERPGRWVAEEAWPSPRIESRRWYLNVLSLGERPDKEDRMRIASPQTTGLAAGDWYGFGAEGEAPTDQREDDGKSLVFDSDPLDQRLEILGSPVVSLDLAVDRPVAYVIVRLNDVAPDGASTRVSYGILNLTQRESRERPEPLEPGQRYRVSLKLNASAYAFSPHHTIRISVSTSYWPVIWPAPEPVNLTVYTGTSWLELPQRPPREADDSLRPFALPERGPRPELTTLSTAPFRRRVERDLTTNMTVYRISSDGGDFGGAALARIEDIDLTVGYTISKTYTIHEYDPDLAEAVIEQVTTHRRGDWSTRLECRTQLTATARTFRVRGILKAYEGTDLFARREWDEEVTRDLL